jgi:hypothetical protein
MTITRRRRGNGPPSHKKWNLRSRVGRPEVASTRTTRQKVSSRADRFVSVNSSTTATPTIEARKNSNTSLDNLPLFVYEPLGRDEIRLLYVEHHDDDVIWSLKTAQLPPEGDYSLGFDALSYTWGDPGRTFSFVCNGAILYIHQNLHDALPFLARRNSKLPIWVDAVCINQANEEDKLVQIPMMGRIYRHANQVWAWLGLHTAETAEAIALFPRIIQVGAHFEAILARGEGLPMDTPAASVGLPDLTCSVWDGVNQIIQSPWFGRLWVVQESSLARAIKVLCGPYEIDWDMLEELQLNITQLWALEGWWWKPERCLAQGRPGGFRQMFMNRKIFQSSDCWLDPCPPTIALALSTALKSTISANHLSCRDPSDRIFAILGFSPNNTALDALVRNHTTHVELYTRFCNFLLFSHKDKITKAWILNFMLSSATGLSRNTNLPSWVPNLHGTERFPLMKYTTERKTRGRLSLRKGGGLRRITLRALIYDVIEAIYPEVPGTSESTLRVLDWEAGVAKLVLVRTNANDRLSSLRSEVGRLSTDTYCETLLGGPWFLRLSAFTDFDDFRRLKNEVSVERDRLTG